MVGLDGLRGLCQPKWFSDGLKHKSLAGVCLEHCLLGAEGPGWGRPLRAPSLTSILKMVGAGGGTTCRMGCLGSGLSGSPGIHVSLAICPVAGDESPPSPGHLRGQGGLVCHGGQPPRPLSLWFQMGPEQVGRAIRVSQTFLAKPGPTWPHVLETLERGTASYPEFGMTLWDEREGCKQAGSVHQRCLPFCPCF